MKHLYYVRHGESYINLNEKSIELSGSSDAWGLTDVGKEQAQLGATKAKAEMIKPDLIICSPLKRTRETAAVFAKSLGYPIDQIAYVDLFKEIRFGELDGMTYADFTKHHSYADLGKFKGAETIEELQKRATKALEYVRSHPEETILIVSHSCFGRAFRRVINGVPYTDEFEPGKNDPLPFASVIKLI